MKKIRKEKQRTVKGITLISLVTTIIILIILAGVSMNLVLGENGLFEKIKLAKEKLDEAQAKENEILGDYINSIDSYIDSNRDELQKNNITMTSPQYLCKITLPTQVRNAGIYSASSSSYNKVNDETNFSKYLEFEENKGWKILKSGLYCLNITYQGAANGDAESAWIYGTLYVNSYQMSVHRSYIVSKDLDVQTGSQTITLFLEQNDVIDYKEDIKPTTLRHSMVEINIYAMTK